MIRRTALKTLISLSAIGLFMLNNPQKSYAGSSGGSSGGGSSGGNDSSSGGSSGGNDSSRGGSSGGNDSSSGGSSGGNDSSSGGSSSSGGGSSPDAPSGPDDSLRGRDSNDTNSQIELIENLNQSLQSDGLQTVTPDNLQSALEAFK